MASVLKGRRQVRTLDGACPSAHPRQERLPLALVSLTVLRPRLARPRVTGASPLLPPEHRRLERRLPSPEAREHSRMALSQVGLSPDPPSRPRGWPIELVWLLAIVLTGNLVGAVLVFVWAWWSRTPLARLGFVRPRSILRAVAFGVVGGIALKLVVKAAIMPALGFDAANPVYRDVIGNPSALWRMLAVVVVGGGIGEETIWRGYLFDRIKTLSGGRVGRLAIIIVTSLAFAAAHDADQGVAGVAQAAITGVSLGAIYALSGNLWTPMIFHAAYDVTALLIIYWDLESAVGHALFR